jgi:hypothetical protein
MGLGLRTVKYGSSCRPLGAPDSLGSLAVAQHRTGERS